MLRVVQCNHTGYMSLAMSRCQGMFKLYSLSAVLRCNDLVAVRTNKGGTLPIPCLAYVCLTYLPSRPWSVCLCVFLQIDVLVSHLYRTGLAASYGGYPGSLMASMSTSRLSDI